ncbi:MAG: hypothetical protein L0099_07220 [Acidobacteria bacterium]|nr:hypothetical protein [Acidobacteriota bacterium]
MSNVDDLRGMLKGFMGIETVQNDGRCLYTIKTAGPQELKKPNSEETEVSPVLTFVETNKILVLSKSRVEQLADIFGENADLVGKRIAVTVGQIKVRGRSMLSVVIEAP